MINNFFPSEKKFVLVAGACLFTFMTIFSAQAYYTPLNPNVAGAKAQPRKNHRSQESLLVPGRWDPKVRKALEDLIGNSGRQSVRYDAAKPPVAVVPWENAAFAGDASEVVFARMVKDAHFKVDDNFWDIIPLGFGRQRIRAAYEQFSALPRGIWDEEPTYRQYRKYLLESYLDLCSNGERDQGRILLARLFKGFDKTEAKDYAGQIINEQMAVPLRQETLGDAPGDLHPAKINMGLREVPEIKDLVRVLLREGFDVWVLDADPQNVLEAAAGRYGVDASRVIGIKTGVERGRLTAEVQNIVPVRGAKTSTIVAAVGRTPALVVGVSQDDADLLGYGQGVRLLLDRGDKKLQELAVKNHWLIQSAFAP